MILQIWEKEEISCGWKTGLIVPIYAKRMQKRYEKYRGATLLSVAYETIPSIILNKVYTEFEVAEYTDTVSDRESRR